MFENLGWGEIITLLMIGLFVFGPDKLPKAISDGLNFIRNMRKMARNASADLSRELGTDVDIADLHPKTFLRKHVLNDLDADEWKREIDEIRMDLEKTISMDPAESEPAAALEGTNGKRIDLAKASDKPAPAYDADAT